MRQAIEIGMGLYKDQCNYNFTSRHRSDSVAPYSHMHPASKRVGKLAGEGTGHRV